MIDALAKGEAWEAGLRAAGYSEKAGQRMWKDTGFQEEVLRRSEQYLMWYLPKARFTLVEQMRTEAPNIAQSAAKELMRQVESFAQEGVGNQPVYFDGVGGAPASPEREEVWTKEAHPEGGGDEARHTD